MFQLFLLMGSLLYGFIVGFFNFLLKNHKVLKILCFFLETLVYIGLFYYINNGEIHLYNKLTLILGYSLFYAFLNVKLNIKFKRKNRKS